MGVGYFNQDGFGFGYSITYRKNGKQANQAGRNGIECEICQTALRVMKALTDQPESVIMKAVILSHPPFEIPYLNSQEPRGFVGDCRVCTLPSSRIKS